MVLKTSAFSCIIFNFLTMTAFAYAADDKAIEAQYELLNHNQLDLYSLNDDQIDDLIVMANNKILNHQLKLYTGTKYFAEYPDRLTLKCHDDENLSQVLARLYLRKAEVDPNAYQKTYDNFHQILERFVPSNLKPPKLEAIDFEKLSSDPAALEAFLLSLLEMDQYLAARYIFGDVTKKAKKIVDGNKNRSLSYNALLSPIKCGYIEDLGQIVDKILQTSGWPKPDEVGRRSSQALWLIMQHQDQNPARQRAALLMVKEAIEKYGVKKSYYAYLEDRININQGKPQRFGTQMFGCDGKTLVDKSKVDIWRKEYGMGPLEEYLHCDERDEPFVIKFQ